MATVTLLYFGQSTGGAYTTISGSLTNTVALGDVLIGMQVGLSAAAGTDPTDSNGTWTKQVAEYNARTGNSSTYGGFYTQLAPAAGSHVVTPQVVAGGSDGLFYLVKVSGMTTPTIRTGQKKAQLTSAQTFSVSTAGTATAGDLVFGIRCHENSVALNPATFSAKPTWATDFGDYLNGGVNLPTNAGYYVSAGGTETLSWTNIDTTITDTSGAALVLFDATSGTNTTLPVTKGTYSVTGTTTNFSLVNHSFKVTVAQGSYALNGQTTNLTYSRSSVATAMPASLGTYSITGRTANLTFAPGTGGSKVVSAVVGTYSIAPRTTNLVYGPGGGLANPGNLTFRNVFQVSASGRVKWVNYFPVKFIVVTAAKANRFDSDGAMAVKELTSVVGLREWVDYTPVVISTDSGTWRYDDTGYIPVVRIVG